MTENLFPWKPENQECRHVTESGSDKYMYLDLQVASMTEKNFKLL